MGGKGHYRALDKCHTRAGGPHHDQSSIWVMRSSVAEEVDRNPLRRAGRRSRSDPKRSAPLGKQLVATAVLCYKCNMTSVGVRELRQRASELLRLVEQGEVIEITDRGRPVARLTPLPTGTPLERMRASGEIEPASGDIKDLPEPVVLPDGVETPSAALARLRSQER
jgi:prevent-host-death family protein